MRFRKLKRRFKKACCFVFYTHCVRAGFSIIYSGLTFIFLSPFFSSEKTGTSFEMWTALFVASLFLCVPVLIEKSKKWSREFKNETSLQEFFEEMT